MTQVWSATQISVDLSGGGTTTVTQGGSKVFDAAYGSEGFSSGKFYWEGSPSTLDQSNAALAGVGNTSSSIASGQWVGVDSNSLGIYSGGTNYQFWANNALQLTVAAGQTFVDGDRFAIALDCDNNLLWIKNVTQAGPWFGAATSGDPAAGTNGFSLTQTGFTIIAHPVVPGCTLYTNNTTYTANFAQAEWAGIAPSGFGPSDPASTIVAVRNSLTVESAFFETVDGAVLADSMSAIFTGAGQRTIWWRAN